jgi:hypothetical protein
MRRARSEIKRFAVRIGRNDLIQNLSVLMAARVLDASAGQAVSEPSIEEGPENGCVGR